MWLREDVKAGEVSEPFLFSGWEHRSLHIVNDSTTPFSVVLEIDGKQRDSAITVAPGATEAVTFSEQGEWIRLRAMTAGEKVSARNGFWDSVKFFRAEAKSAARRLCSVSAACSAFCASLKASPARLAALMARCISFSLVERVSSALRPAASGSSSTASSASA